MNQQPDDIANDPRVGLLRLAFDFLIQQQYFGSAAMMVAEYIGHIKRIENAESSGRLSVESVRLASDIWQREVKGFQHWFGANDEGTIARLMQELADKGIQKFVEDLMVELQIDRTPDVQTESMGADDE